MNLRTNLISLITLVLMMVSCNKPVTQLTYKNPDAMVVFLHHSTGSLVWHGDIKPNKRIYLKESICMVPRLIKEYNDQNNIKISVEERAFPKGSPYSWTNYPYDYYNIWVKNSGTEPFKEEPTLEILTETYDVIILKHCFPVSYILEDKGEGDINSDKKTLTNYKLQYNALRKKIREFPDTKFIVWTGAALVEKVTNAEEAKRAQEFAEWVKSEWDEPDDNIYIFDFRQIQTEGGLYLKPEYAASSTDSHPNTVLSKKAAVSLVDTIVKVVEGMNL